MHVECRMMIDSRRVFDEMPERNFVSWNTIIKGLVDPNPRHFHLEKPQKSKNSKNPNHIQPFSQSVRSHCQNHHSSYTSLPKQYPPNRMNQNRVSPHAHEPFSHIEHLANKSMTPEIEGEASARIYSRYIDAVVEKGLIFLGATSGPLPRVAPPKPQGATLFFKKKKLFLNKIIKKIIWG
jgi:hypothetical protein